MRGSVDVFDVPPSPDHDYADRMRGVLRDVQRVDHKGVLAFFDVGLLADGRPYVIREPLDGDTLAVRIAEKRPKTREALAILLAICDVLISAHAAGVAHGALDLDHIVLGPQLKLIDWGISDIIADEADEAPPRVRELSPAVDVFALAQIAHRLFDRIPPGLEGLWIGMMAEEPSRRPTIGVVTKRLALALQAIESGEVRIQRIERPLALPMPHPWRARLRNAAVAVSCAAPVLYVFLSREPGPRNATAEPQVVAARPHTIAVRSTPATSAPLPAVVAAPAAEPSTTAPPAVVAAPAAEPPTTATTPAVVAAPAVEPPPPTSAAEPIPRATPRAVAKTRTADRELLLQLQRVDHDVQVLRDGGEAVTDLVERVRSVRRMLNDPKQHDAATAALQEIATDLDSLRAPE